MNDQQTDPFNHPTLELVLPSEEYPTLQEAMKQHIAQIVQHSSAYQIRVIVLSCLIWMSIAYASMVAPFVFMNPLIQCQGKPTPEHQACAIMDQCQFINKFTATYTHRLYCEGESLRLFIQSLFPIGCLVGMFLLPFVSDCLGRKTALIIGLGLGQTGAGVLLLGLHLHIISLVIVGQLLSGIFASGCSILTYVVTEETCTDSQRQKAIPYYNAIWGLSQASFYWISAYMPQWHPFIFYLILLPTSATFLLALFGLYEAPAFYLIKGLDGSYLETMRKMARINRLTQEECQQLAIPANFGRLSEKTSILKQIFEDREAKQAIVLLATGILGYNIFYFGMQGSMERTGYSFGLSMLLAGSHEVVGFLLASTLVGFLPRIKGLLICNCTAALLGLAFALPAISRSAAIQSVLISAIRIACVFSYSLFSMLKIESFRPELRSSAIGILMGLSQLGRIFVPYIVNWMNERGVHSIVATSMFYMLLGSLPLLRLRETLPGTKTIYNRLLDHNLE